MITYISPNLGLTNAVAFYTPTLFVALIETTPGRYEGELPPNTPKADYTLTIKEGTTLGGYALYPWDGNKEITLSQIALDAAIASKSDKNNTVTDKVTAITEVKDDDGATTLYRFQTFNALGQPSVDDAVRRELIP